MNNISGMNAGVEKYDREKAGRGILNAHVSNWGWTRTAVLRGNTGWIYPSLLLCVLVFLMVMPWHLVNQRLPIWDSADYVLTIQNIIARSEHGFIDGLKALYLERGWRPIIFPSLAAPFFWLMDGRILMGVGLTQYFAALLLAGYVYFFLKQTASWQKALIGSLLVVSTQWIIDFTNIFYAELFWLASTSGALYHLAAAYRNESSLHFAVGGLWLGLMGALRPIETATLTVIPIAILVFRGWKQNNVRGADLGLFVAQLFAAGLAIWFLAMPEKHKLAVSGLLGLSAFTIIFRLRRFLSESPILGFLLLAEAIALVWHLPTIRSLYLWVYDTSFGPLAQLSDQRFSGLAPWSVFWELLQRYSPVPLLLLTTASFLGAMTLRQSNSTPERQAALVIIVLATLMIAPMLVLLSISGTSDMRRIMPGMLVLSAGLVMLALSPHGLLPRVRGALLFLLMASQVMGAIANGFNVHVPAFRMAREFTGHLRQPYTGLDPNIPVLDGILGLGIWSGRIAAYTYCYRDYANCETQAIPMFEPMALSTLAKERRLPIHVHFIGDLDFTKPETLSAQIRERGFNFVLIDMFDSPAAVNWDDPYVIHTKNFIALRRGKLPAGLVNRGCFMTVKRPICVAEVP